MKTVGAIMLLDFDAKANVTGELRCRLPAVFAQTISLL